MNGKKAKKIRREVYQEMSSHPAATRYQMMPSGEIRAMGLRRVYQAAKTAHKRRLL